MGVGASASSLQVGLLKAVSNGNTGGVVVHLQFGADPNFVLVTLQQGAISPLYLAVLKGHATIVDLLLKANANPDRKCSRQCDTPLGAAAERGFINCMKLLIARGANVNLGDDDGDTPLHMAALKGEAEAALLLLGNNASPHKRNDKQWTPLHCACVSGNLAIIIALKAAGADTHAADIAGLKPAALALASGHHAAVAILMAAE